MIHQERGRLSIAVGFSVVVHVVVAVFSGFFASPPALPDYLPPLRVELNAPEPQTRPEPETPPQNPPPVPEEPVPEPEPEPVAPETTPAPARPQAPGRGSSGVADDPLRGPPPEEITEADIWDRTEPTEPRQRRSSEDVLRATPDSLAPDVTLPDWAGTVLSRAGISRERMSDSETIELAKRIQDTEFARLLTDAIAGVNRRAAEPGPGAAPRETSGPGTGTEGPAAESADGSQGDPRLVWEGDNRGGAGPLPELTAADFENQVPAETRFVVIFEVNEGGVVVPGSIIFQQRSRYTQANEKLRRAIASWRFDSARGAGTQSAVFTLIVRREDVR